MNLFSMVTTKRSGAYTDYALRTFFAHTKLQQGDRFVLIDNDGEYSLPTELEGRAIELRRNSAPKGFAENANIAIGEASKTNADLFFLNDDIIFTEEWLTPLLVSDAAILSPLSNREVQYAANVTVPKTHHTASAFNCEMVMKLEQYVANPAAIDLIAHANRTANSGYWNVYVLPFFCIKIPAVVYAALGRFDESFGKGGAEDYDYALRSYLAGFPVRFALGSWVLHFGGRSSHAGGEPREKQLEREAKFKSVFKEKWGKALFDLVLQENTQQIQTDLSLRELESRGDFAAVIRQMLGGREIEQKI